MMRSFIEEAREEIKKSQVLLSSIFSTEDKGDALSRMFESEDFSLSSFLRKGRKIREKKDFWGLPLSIEFKRGDVRQGKDEKGNPWKNIMQCDYGYIRGTLGVDGDHLDVYVGTHTQEKDAMVFVLHQKHKDGSYDEDKVMLGFKTKQDAINAYKHHMKARDAPFPTVTEMSLEDFKKKIKDSKEHPKRLGVGEKI